MLTVAGWKIDHISVGVTEHLYPTNWGDPLYPAEPTYTQFQYNIHLRRPVLGYLATTLLPLAVVMLITMIVYLIDPSYVGAAALRNEACVDYLIAETDGPV